MKNTPTVAKPLTCTRKRVRALIRLARVFAVGLGFAIIIQAPPANASAFTWILEKVAEIVIGELVEKVVNGSLEQQVHNNYVQVVQIVNNPPPDVDIEEVKRYAKALSQIEGLAFRGRVANNDRERIEMATAIKQIALDMVDLEARVLRLEERVTNLEGQVARNTDDIYQIRTEYDTLLEEQLLRRPLMEASGAFASQLFVPWSRRSRLAAGAEFKYIFQGKYVLGGLGYSFHNVNPGWAHFVYGQIGAQYHWRYVTLTGSVRGGYRFLDGTTGIGPIAAGIATGFKFYPHHNIPMELEFNATQSESDTSLGMALGIGTRGEWVAAGIGIALLLALGAGGN